MDRTGGRTLASAVADAARRLEAAGAAAIDAQRDAGVLARAVLGWDPARWLLDRGAPPPAAFEPAFAAVVARRSTGEPLAYILGEREFYGRPFLVTPDVLIPRPETELVVDRALAARARGARGSSPLLLDIGTGSGCLAITLALECVGARVIATDVSAAALEVAARNAARHGVVSRVELRHGPLTAGVAEASLIVSNPPYVGEQDRAALPGEVRDHEPGVALFGGPDGLDVIRTLVPAAAHALRADGCLILEIGAGQWPAVRDIANASGFASVEAFEDLAGIPRVVVAAAPRG